MRAFIMPLAIGILLSAGLGYRPRIRRASR